MKVTKVRLQNFLSYPLGEVSFSDGINAITGENAVGKTNLIDSIYYASIGKSSRYNKDKDLIRWQSENGTYVLVEVQKRFGKHKVEFYIDMQGRKAVRVDGLPIQKIGELMGVINVIFFSPDEISLIKESPEYRRRFMDISLCQQSKTYFYTLQKYKKLLVQRNTILKMNSGKPALEDMLSIVDGDFVRCAGFIIRERAKFVQKIMPYAQEKHRIITSNKEELRLVYETEPVGFEDLEQNLAIRLKQSRDKDCKLLYTNVGPHRDDIKIASNDVDIRTYGSQGQQRSAVLSLKLAEIELFKERTGEAPVLLLDDVLSELDATRRVALFSALDGIQTLVTCTEYNKELREKDKKIIIKDHQIFTE